MRSGIAFNAGIGLLVFLSGFAGLVYEVLWLKELGLLFGNTAQAAATTLAAFFLGIAAGGRYWGARASRLASPLKAYGYIEWAIAASALPYFLLLKLYHLLYEPLYSTLGESTALLTGAKLLLAAVVLFPPAFFMGGTFPVMGQHLVRSPNQLGRMGSLLYGINTLGAALGAFCAGFYLPGAFGIGHSYFLAIGLNVTVGLTAWLMASKAAPAPTTKPRRPTGKRSAPLMPLALPAGWLAFLSGFLAIGLEVLWTRMFSQVLQNSVYTFSAILVVFLVVLSFGAFVANRLCRLRTEPATVLAVLMTLAGLSVAASPYLFMDVTDGMRYLGSGLPWGPYLVTIFTRTTIVLLLPGILIGSIFPYLLRAVEGRGSAGEILGRMAALNTLGSVAGSVAAGFLLLPVAGLWGGVRVFALAYLLAALLLPAGASRAALVLRAGPAVAILLLFTVLDATKLPLIRVPRDDERVLETWEGSHGIVAVVERPSGLRIKVNNFYRLGGSASLEHEQNQALIPLMTHPRPDDVFFLGMGTGITAGAALRQPVERVVVCELVPEVVDAGAKYFNEFAGGLFTDPRVRILRTDGRNHLFGTRDKYDVIIGDLFIPWKEGSGSLYSIEHFEVVSRRLKPDGVFVQWLPLYQVSRDEFNIIARTLLEVFPEVVLWRGDFYPERPILAFVASNEPRTLDPNLLAARGRTMAGNPNLPAQAIEAVTVPFYAGNLGRSRQTIPPGPVNTDGRPLIEYGSPVTHRTSRSGDERWFNGNELVHFFDSLREATPPAKDPYLSQLDRRQLGYVEAGFLYYDGAVAKRNGDDELARRRLAQFHAKLPVEFRPATDDSEVASSVGE